MGGPIDAAYSQAMAVKRQRTGWPKSFGFLRNFPPCDLVATVAPLRVINHWAQLRQYPAAHLSRIGACLAASLSPGSLQGQFQRSEYEEGTKNGVDPAR